MKTPARLFPSTALLLLAAAPCAAADWSSIMGPNNNRKTAEAAPAKWTAEAPRKLWDIPVEGGFGSFVTGEGRAYVVLPTMVAGELRETLAAVDRKTGKTLWQTPLGHAKDYDGGGMRGAKGNDGGDGPRATPVFSNGRVFVLGSKFDLHAIKADTGALLWKKELMADFGGRRIQWASAASPVVLADRVIVSGGGEGQSALAFRPDNGEVLWKTGNDRATHSTPILATIHGKEQVLFMVERGLVSRDPANGKELWHYPFPYRTSTGPSPVVWQDIVNVSAGYGVGGGACQVLRSGDTWETKELWRSPGNRDTAAHWSTAVAHDGYLYGCYGHGEYGVGAFKCIDIRTGAVKWEQKGFGHGQTIMAGGRILSTSDAGQLRVIEPTPDVFRELATAKVIDGKVWASLAFTDGQLFLRSTKQGVCLEL